MTTQAEFWKGKGGDEYTARNRVDWRARIPFWKRIIDVTGARSVFEFGCNAGWNLSAIRRAYPDVMVYGKEINEIASAQTRACLGIKNSCNLVIGAVELSFTAGVLIHIAPESLEATMQEVIDASCDWVLAVEYAADTEQMIEYRGQQNLLWKRPYGDLYESMGLTKVEAGGYEACAGFDRCTYWLMRK